ncbi:alpha-1,2-fucosyltransferase [Roseovarius aestuariivivens]|uniref:alpha-1,2-fucosyltransferase n=1 Tax=Roseovarius aestuariivivens TaxID=1888910 RepID=UPI0010815D15|nr:alpha-1,2-fucosyltransferase [Roseovarius aestuariivivens]
MSKARIVTRLFGGTGNQLFQYAAGRALADHLGCALQLDTRYVAGSADRGDCFAHFGKARMTHATSLPPSKSDSLIFYSLWRLFGRNPRFHREKTLAFNRRFFDLPTNTYLHGYWQSEKYFAHMAKQIREDLEFTTPLDAANAEMAQRIAAAENPVSFHVRRGDYMASGTYAAIPADYYARASEHLQARCKGPLTCFVFSNDPDWARDNLDLGQETVIVDHNDETKGHFDLHLQSLCAHNVIANSTFSWWAAWLNANPDKSVVAPKQWFADPKLSNPDLYPTQWSAI